MIFDSDTKHWLSLSLDANYEAVAEELEKRVNSVCKPCWELKYCPYGHLVEDFPLPPLNRENAIVHFEYLKTSLSTGLLGSGKPLDDESRKFFENCVNEFNPEDYPETLPQPLIDGKCKIFGHLCPVFFVKESFAEIRGMDIIERIVEESMG